ncbi:MAG: hypothetical protein ACJ8J7_06480 [Sulfurifustaceae bacterium]
MALKRKSIVQFFILVLLLLAAGGVYLWQQGQLDFVTDLIGLTEPAKPAAAPPAAKRQRPGSPSSAGAPAENKVRVAAPAIPDHPARGEVQKAAFVVETAEFENGVLTLRQGKDALGTEIKLFLRTQPWHVPEQQNFKISAQGSAQDVPLIRVRWNEGGQKAPRQRDFTEKYTLRLEFDRERERKLPGKIYLQLADEDKSQVAGTFTADIRGFRFIDGKPDLTVDAIDTLQYLALREVLKDDPDKAISDPAFRQGRYGTSGNPPTGSLDLEYRTGDALVMQRFQFAKEQGTWRVAHILRPDQLDEAHPYRVPGTKDAPERLFTYLAAKRVEADAQKQSPGRALTATEFTTRYNEKRKIGVTEVSYRVGDTQPMRKTFLYQLKPNGWVLVRELTRKERANLTTGKVETAR